MTKRKGQAVAKRRRRTVAKRPSAPGPEPGPRVVPDPFVYRFDPSDKPRAALEIAIARFRARPEVTGIDLGFEIKSGKHTKRLAVRIHVREKVGRRHLTPRERFPDHILGVPVDVIAAVYEDHHVFDPARQTAVPIIRPGLSVSALNGDTGTLGLLVEDITDGKQLILGSAHVFGRAPDPQGGMTPIIQPGRADGGGAPDAIGTLLRSDRGTDTAVAVATGARPFDSHILGAANDVTGLRHPQRGDILEKSGRTTGITRGFVDSIVREFAGLQFVMRLVPLPGADGPICDFGDSGSVWYDPGTGEAVAIHCKGGSTPTQANAYAIATSLIYATQALGVRLPPGGGG